MSDPSAPKVRASSSDDGEFAKLPEIAGEPPVGSHPLETRTTGGGSIAGGTASAGGPAIDADPGEALSVTRLAPFTDGISWHNVACGIDTLDLGIDVTWGAGWESLQKELEEGKERAAGSQGHLSSDRRFLHLPSGKPPSYRWHLEWPDFHLYLGVSQTPQQNTPNVYASINAKTLWRLPLAEAVGLVEAEIQSLGGTIATIKPSRCDLAADFVLPQPVTLEFLLEHRVPRHVQHSHNMTGDVLETFYHGAKKSPIQLRIYDKSLEVLKGGTKGWFFKIWGVSVDTQVWRVEFQLRRPYLRQAGIHTVADLQAKAGGIWQYLTCDWFSLRLDDDRNVSRCTVHPGWQQVQQSAGQFGAECLVGRDVGSGGADVDWYVSHCAGCLAGFAARKRINDFWEAWESLGNGVLQYWTRNDFLKAVAVKSIQLGYTADRDSIKAAVAKALAAEWESQ